MSASSLHDHPSLAVTLTHDFVERLKEAFSADAWLEGKPVRLSFWMRFLFAIVSSDWNRIHFHRVVKLKQHRRVIAHGAMINCLLPRLTSEVIARLHEIASKSGRAVIDSSATCKFVNLCGADSVVFARVRRKSVRAVGGDVFMSLEYEIWSGDEVIQTGTRLLTFPAVP